MTSPRLAARSLNLGELLFMRNPPRQIRIADTGRTVAKMQRPGDCESVVRFDLGDQKETLRSRRLRCLIGTALRRSLERERKVYDFSRLT